MPVVSSALVLLPVPLIDSQFGNVVAWIRPHTTPAWDALRNSAYFAILDT